MWLIASFFAGVIGWIVGKSQSPHPAGTIVSGVPRGVPSAVDTLTLCLSKGHPFPVTLVHAAMRECYEAGDAETFQALHKAFPQPSEPSPTEPSSPELPAPAPASAPPVTSIVYGVSDAEWSEFVRTLASEDSTFRDARHVGCFRHNIQRLAELGIDPESLTDPSSQYQALEADFKDILQRDAKLINEFAGDVIVLNGQNTPITRSGILTLIKCAGSEGAREWLSDESDRIRHPHTTKRFLASNSIF